MTANPGFEGVDIALDATGSCNLAKINSCCRLAIQNGVNTLGPDNYTSAELEVSCDGPDPDLGCQAQIIGSLLDRSGEVVLVINTSARDLMNVAEN